MGNLAGGWCLDSLSVLASDSESVLSSLRVASLELLRRAPPGYAVRPRRGVPGPMELPPFKTG